MTYHETLSTLRDLTDLPPAECRERLIATVDRLQLELDTALDAEADAWAARLAITREPWLAAFDANTHVSVDGGAPVSWPEFLADHRAAFSSEDLAELVDDLRACGVCFLGAECAPLRQVWLA